MLHLTSDDLEPPSFFGLSPTAFAGMQAYRYQRCELLQSSRSMLDIHLAAYAS